MAIQSLSSRCLCNWSKGIAWLPVRSSHSGKLVWFRTVYRSIDVTDWIRHGGCVEVWLLPDEYLLYKLSCP